MNDILIASNLIILLIVYFFIGAIMFLLPPVPGVPVQVVGGMMISNYMHVNQDGDGEYLWFYLGSIVATVFATFIKLFSLLALQFLAFKQSDNVQIQSEVGTHKPFMKAIGDIFRKEEYQWTQVLCFSGMPDWPMSALTGLLKLDYLRVQLACLPVGFLCFLQAFSGSCMVIKGDWFANLNSTVMLITVIIQVIFMYLATSQITEYINEHYDYYNDPNNLTPDEILLFQEEMKLQKQNNQVLMASNLNIQSCFNYLILIVILTLMTFSLQVSVIFGDDAFRNFALSSKIDDPYESDGLNGSWQNIVKPLGLQVCIVFMVGLLLYQFYKKQIEQSVQLQNQQMFNLNDGILMIVTKNKGVEHTWIHSLLLISDFETKEQNIKNEQQLQKTLNNKLLKMMNLNRRFLTTKSEILSNAELQKYQSEQGIIDSTYKETSIEQFKKDMLNELGKNPVQDSVIEEIINENNENQ